MPCPYPKGSQEAKEFMARLRARRGKGVCGGKRRISVRMKKGGAILPAILLGILAVKGAKKLISKIRGGKVESAKSIGKKFAEFVEKHPKLKNQGLKRWDIKLSELDRQMGKNPVLEEMERNRRLREMEEKYHLREADDLSP